MWNNELKKKRKNHFELTIKMLLFIILLKIKNTNSISGISAKATLFRLRIPFRNDLKANFLNEIRPIFSHTSNNVVIRTPMFHFHVLLFRYCAQFEVTKVSKACHTDSDYKALREGMFSFVFIWSRGNWNVGNQSRISGGFIVQ